jgi:hypothetical protein
MALGWSSELVDLAIDDCQVCANQIRGYGTLDTVSSVRTTLPIHRNGH